MPSRANRISGGGSHLEAEGDAGEHRLQIEDVERLLGRAQVAAGRPRGLAAALEVAGEHHRIRLAALLQPLAREPVPERRSSSISVA